MRADNDELAQDALAFGFLRMVALTLAQDALTRDPAHGLDLLRRIERGIEAGVALAAARNEVLPPEVLASARARVVAVVSEAMRMAELLV